MPAVTLDAPIDWRQDKRVTRRTSVFMSYSRESDTHVRWVTRLANALEETRGITVVFDEYDVYGGKDLAQFMESGLRCDRIVIVVTPSYVAKSNARQGGVGFESSIISADLLKGEADGRLIPILREGEARPAYLRTKAYIDFRQDSEFAFALADLLSAVRGRPRAMRPKKLRETEGEVRPTLEALERLLPSPKVLPFPIMMQYALESWPGLREVCYDLFFAFDGLYLALSNLDDATWDLSSGYARFKLPNPQLFAAASEVLHRYVHLLHRAVACASHCVRRNMPERDIEHFRAISSAVNALIETTTDAEAGLASERLNPAGYPWLSVAWELRDRARNLYDVASIQTKQSLL